LLPFSLQQNQKEESNDSLLLSPSLLQQNQKEEGNNNLLLSPSSFTTKLKRKRQQHLANVVFFVAT